MAAVLARATGPRWSRPTCPPPGPSWSGLTRAPLGWTRRPWLPSWRSPWPKMELSNARTTWAELALSEAQHRAELELSSARSTGPSWAPGRSRSGPGWSCPMLAAPGASWGAWMRAAPGPSWDHPRHAPGPSWSCPTLAHRAGLKLSATRAPGQAGRLDAHDTRAEQELSEAHWASGSAAMVPRWRRWWHRWNSRRSPVRAPRARRCPAAPPLRAHSFHLTRAALACPSVRLPITVHASPMAWTPPVALCHSCPG